MEAGVLTVEGEEFGVGAGLDDSSVFHYANHVGIDNSREAVCNHYRGAVCH